MINRLKYINSKVVQYNYDSDEYTRKYYDSYIVKSSHYSDVLGNYESIEFEILNEFFDEISIFNFENVSDVIAKNSLTIFPEIRLIEIIKIKDSLNKCIFVPMWSNCKIEFNFIKVTITQNKLKTPITRKE